MAIAFEQAIGRNLTRLREAKGWNQVEMGKALEAPLGQEWSRQAVWLAEKGKRSFAVSDLIGLAAALDVTVGELVTPADDVTEVLLGKSTMSSEQIMSIVQPPAPAAQAWQSFIALSRLRNVVRTVEREYNDALREVRADAAANPELRAMVEEYLHKCVETEKKRAQRDAARDDEDVSTPEKLEAYMKQWGHLDIPAIASAQDVLTEGKADGEGN